MPGRAGQGMDEIGPWQAAAAADKLGSLRRDRAGKASPLISVAKQRFLRMEGSDISITCYARTENLDRRII